MKSLRILTPAVAVLFLISACVTINIYFPEAQAEKAAEKIVDDILGKPPATRRDDGALNPSGDLFLRIAGGVLDIAVPSVQAAQPDFNVASPEIRKIQSEMKRRHQSLSPFYDAGAIGFSRDALVSVRDLTAASLKDRNRLKQLVKAENRDRNALYQAIARANGHPEWEPQIRQTFAGTWIKKAAAGWSYEDVKGQWRRK